MVTQFNKAVIDTAAELLGKQCRKRQPWVTPEILDLCDQRRDFNKQRCEPEGAKDTIERLKKSRTEMKMANDTLIQSQILLHIKVRLPVLLCAVKTVEGDFRFCWTTTPNVGQTHKENPNLVRILYMVCTLNDIYKQYNKLHEH